MGVQGLPPSLTPQGESMGYFWLELIISLIVIVIAAQLLTNALEHFAQKINISAGVTGSVLAAIATALPETFVPILAIVAGTSNKSVNEEVSVGAILGAPLMLATLATFLMAISVVKARGFTGRIRPEKTGMTRDLNFFLIAFFFAAIAMYLPLEPIYLRVITSLILICLYAVYLLRTIKASKQLVVEGHGVIIEEPMTLTRIGLKNNSMTLILQLILGLALLFFGAKRFIASVEELSNALHVSALVLSLLIIPVATELPEKINSILWVRRNKDTLAFGNLTGAMVFQGTLLPAIGILLTPWQPNREVQTCIIITFLAAIWLRVNVSSRGLSIMALCVNGGLYVLYFLLLV